MEISPADFHHDEPIELPPGFRFHPTDEELITRYLFPKVIDTSFTTKIIGEVDLNKVEPWDLPWKAKMGEKEWYFFCLRDRKYPSGSRTNRATEAGYWKATGKDKEIFREKALVGMKKTLVFYRGRAPKGVKTNWVMHEHRLDGKYSNRNLPNTAKKEWVICRVFKKSSGGKKVHISCLKQYGASDPRSIHRLPPLMEGDHVTCFSNSLEDHCPDQADEFSPCSNKSTLSPHLVPDMQDHQSMLRMLLDDTNLKQNVSSYAMEGGFKVYEDQEFPGGQVDQLDCLWNY